MSGFTRFLPPPNLTYKYFTKNTAMFQICSTPFKSETYLGHFWHISETYLRHIRRWYWTNDLQKNAQKTSLWLNIYIFEACTNGIEQTETIALPNEVNTYSWTNGITIRNYLATKINNIFWCKVHVERMFATRFLCDFYYEFEN